MKNDEKSKEELLKSLKERDEIISQLKHQIEKLKNNQSDPLTESKYKSILENIEEFYYEIDLAGNLTFFNEQLSRIYGYSKEELLGMNNRWEQRL